MRRYTFYILVFLIALIIGCLLGIRYFSESIEETQTIKQTENHTKFLVKEVDGKWQLVPTKEIPATKVDSTLNDEIFETQNKEPKKPFCKDKRILPVWKLLLKNEYFGERTNLTFNEPNCAKMFEVLFFDLNRDGQKEILLRGNLSDLCGATGNCGFWIFGKVGKNYRKLLSASDYVDIIKMGNQIKQRRTNGYRDILLKGHWNASETNYGHYKFINEKYKLVKDLINACFPCSGDNAKWKMITWKEYEKLKLNH